MENKQSRANMVAPDCAECGLKVTTAHYAFTSDIPPLCLGKYNTNTSEYTPSDCEIKWTRKAVGVTGISEKMRLCLGECGQMFMSQSSSHRICDYCQRRNYEENF